ncbi:MAG: hypothetical protein ACI9U2_004219 [Bradymonadia bacterium]|jgi:hypothetical protein
MNGRSTLVIVGSSFVGLAATAAFVAVFARESIILALIAGLPVGLVCRFALTDPARRQVVIGIAAAVALVGGLAAGIALSFGGQLEEAVDKSLTQTVFTETTDAAAAYAAHDALKGNAVFMTSYGWGTDSKDSVQLNPVELNDFEQTEAPHLRWVTETSPDFAAWRAKRRPLLIQFARSKLSVVDLALYNRDWLNTLLMLILAIASAIGLAVGNRRSAATGDVG